MKPWEQGEKVANVASVLGREMVTLKFFLWSVIIYTFCEKLPPMSEFFLFHEKNEQWKFQYLKITLFVIQDHQLQHESNNLIVKFCHLQCSLNWNSPYTTKASVNPANKN